MAGGCWSALCSSTQEDDVDPEHGQDGENGGDDHPPNLKLKPSGPIAYAIVGVGVALGWALYHVVKPGDFVPAPGVSVFALFYILAQAIERTLEPASDSGLLGTDKDEKRLRMWAAACFLAMLACGGLGIFLLHAVGLSTVPPAVDIGITGLAIGSGTKPLHDLIANIQKSSDAKAG